jgi:hypothetical protein
MRESGNCVVCDAALILTALGELERQYQQDEYIAIDPQIVEALAEVERARQLAYSDVISMSNAVIDKHLSTL